MSVYVNQIACCRKGWAPGEVQPIAEGCNFPVLGMCALRFGSCACLTELRMMLVLSGVVRCWIAPRASMVYALSASSLLSGYAVATAADPYCYCPQRGRCSRHWLSRSSVLEAGPVLGSYCRCCNSCCCCCCFCCHSCSRCWMRRCSLRCRLLEAVSDGLDSGPAAIEEPVGHLMVKALLLKAHVLDIVGAGC